MEKEYAGWQKMYIHSEWRQFCCWKTAINLMQEEIVVHRGNQDAVLKDLAGLFTALRLFVLVLKDQKKEGAPNQAPNRKSNCKLQISDI